MCFRTIHRPCAYQPCGHTFCQCCVERCLKYDIRCPICRGHARAFYPSLNVRHSNPKKIKLHLDGTKEFGITLVNTPLGVEIDGFTKRSIASKQGLRMHDTLLAINTIPCYTLSTTRQLLTAAAEASSTVIVHIRRDTAALCGCWYSHKRARVVSLSQGFRRAPSPPAPPLALTPRRGRRRWIFLGGM